jgi:hypothetical protein
MGPVNRSQATLTDLPLDFVAFFHAMGFGVK